MYNVGISKKSVFQAEKKNEGYKDLNERLMAICMKLDLVLVLPTRSTRPPKLKGHRCMPKPPP